MNIERAVEVITADLRGKYGDAFKNLQLDHVDDAGCWFSYELMNDDRRQTWCVRHGEVE